MLSGITLCRADFQFDSIFAVVSVVVLEREGRGALGSRRRGEGGMKEGRERGGRAVTPLGSIQEEDLEFGGGGTATGLLREWSV